MRKITLLFASLVLTFSVFGQLVPVDWVNWLNEPDYANTPYTKAVAVAMESAAAVSVADVSEFDALWSAIEGDAYQIANATDITGGDLFGATFGASFKATYFGNTLYVLFQYKDDDSQANAGSRSFEVMFDANKDRVDTMFAARADLAGQNGAYACYTLFGGKALFADGVVGEYAGSSGVAAGWGTNETGLEALADATHFWDATGTTIKAMLVADLPSVATGFTAPAAGLTDTISFDIKSNATTGDPAAKTEYFWSSNANNGYASLYYRGYLILQAAPTAVNSVRASNVSANLVNNEIRISGVVANNVVVRNIVGQEVKRVNGKNVFSVSDLKKGAYIVTVNNAYSTKIVK
jgi:hypothetical protein